MVIEMAFEETIEMYRTKLKAYAHNNSKDCHYSRCPEHCAGHLLDLDTSIAWLLASYLGPHDSLHYNVGETVSAFEFAKTVLVLHFAKYEKLYIIVKNCFWFLKGSGRLK